MKSYLTTIILILTLFLNSFNSRAQEKYPTDYFRSPVDFRVYLAGTFGELREDHFHSGIDIKTQGMTGVKIHAAADGYVSRIKISGYGYGKAIYINHPNGYTTVYGHLEAYNRAIGAYVKNEQYKLESYEMDIYPDKDKLPVKKGDVIGYSGRSGAAAGPHLHFEIRDAATQEPLNPLLFGIEVKDYYTPKLTYLKIYPADDEARVNGEAAPVRYSLEGWGKGYRISGLKSPITVRGKVSFAIGTYDLQNDSHNKNGVYSIELTVDSVPQFLCRMDKFPFSETRYINSLIDYPEYIKNHVRLERTQVDPGNQLSIYHEVNNNGIYYFNDTLQHQVAFIIKDVKNNESILKFDVKAAYAVPSSKVSIASLGAGTDRFLYNGANHFENEDVKFEAPKGAFYKSFDFEYSKSDRPQDCLSALHHIHNEYTPIQTWCKLSIKPDAISDSLKSKALLVLVNDNGSIQSAGGSMGEDGFVTGPIRSFGNYSVALDTIPPQVVPVSPQHFKNLKGRKEIKFIIKDELSGIGSYKATLNGKWVLFEFDPKNNLITYFIDNHLKPGSNPFRLEVTDNKGNSTVYENNMIY